MLMGRKLPFYLTVANLSDEMVSYLFIKASYLVAKVVLPYLNFRRDTD